MRFLITAGPTREALDPVRFLSNRSTGKMGFSCAEAALEHGHEVVLIAGPVHLATPAGVERVDVISAAEMAEAVHQRFESCDAVIMTAAVCDYRPRHISATKLAKQSGAMTLTLERTEDILASLGADKKHQVLIGFAVQDEEAVARAEAKFQTKNLDAIVLNSPSAFGVDISDIAILTSKHRWEHFQQLPKRVLADKLVRLAESLYRSI